METTTDGQLVPFYVRPMHGLHDGVRGMRRPLSRLEARQLHRDYARISAGDDVQRQDDFLAGVLLNKVESWSLPGDVTSDAIAGLEFNLFERMALMVLHLEESDRDPDGDARQPTDPNKERDDAGKNSTAGY